MIHMETQIKASLIALLEAIKTSNGKIIIEEMDRLDDLLNQGRAALHPQLVHFLERRSYNKAVMFLGGQTDIPAGVCGGRAGRAGGDSR